MDKSGNSIPEFFPNKLNLSVVDTFKFYLQRLVEAGFVSGLTQEEAIDALRQEADRL